MYDNVLEILDELKATTKRTEKDAILVGLLGSSIEPVFKKVCFATYDPTVRFFTVEFEPATAFYSAVSLETAIDDAINILGTRTLSGNMARDWLTSTHGLLSESDAEVFLRVIAGDLKCGVQTKTINKHWPDLIYDHPYMRCSSFNAKNMANVSFPCYSQTKMDGLYVDIIVGDESVEYRSRSGSFLPLNDPERDQMLVDYAAGTVLQGEAIALDPEGKIMKREDGNGYINSDNVDINRIRFYVWDSVSRKGFLDHHDRMHYSGRFSRVASIVDGIEHEFVQRSVANGDYQPVWLYLVDTIEVNSVDEVIQHFKQKRAEGQEGTVVKDRKGVWKYTTSKHQVKVKVIFDCELKVVGWKWGTGKNEGKLGALLCQSADGVVEVSVGGGYKQAERESFVQQADQWVACEQVITVRANDLVESDQKPDTLSLFLPRFVEVRRDKDEADDVERIKEQRDACINVLRAIHSS